MKTLKYIAIALILSGCTSISGPLDCENDTVYILDPEPTRDTIYVPRIETIEIVVYVPIVDTFLYFQVDTVIEKDTLYMDSYDFKAVGLKPMPSIWDKALPKWASDIRSRIEDNYSK